MTYFGKSFGGGRRSTGRSPVVEQAVVSTTSSSASAVIVDLSRTGAKLTGVESVFSGEEIFIRIDKVLLFGTVRWVHDGACGVQFDAAIPPFEFEQMRRSTSVHYLTNRHIEQRFAMDDWESGLAR